MPTSQGFQGKIMHALKIAAAILGVIMLTSGCSSDLDEAKPLSLGKTGSDAAFSFYDADHDLVISPKDIYEGEKQFAATYIDSEAVASQIMVDYDMDSDGQLDHIEFTGLVNARILAGVQKHPEWTSRRSGR